MTESEARNKWCPMAAVTNASLATGGANRVQYTDRNSLPVKGSRCYASECMAWRKINMAGDGYCGLAGEP